MEVQMRSSKFEPLNPSSILAFLHNIKTAYESNGIHERAAMWLFLHSVTEPAKAALSFRVSVTEDNNTHKAETLTTYCQAVRYLLESWAADDAIAEAVTDIINNKQPENMSAVRYLETHWESVLGYGRVYNESIL